MGTLLLIVLIILLIGSVPFWSHSKSWGYLPGGSIGVILLIVIVLVLFRRI